MKAKVKVKIAGFSGRFSNVSVDYKGDSNTYVVLGGASTIPEQSASQKMLQEVVSFIKSLDVSEAYRADCKRYIKRYVSRHRGSNLHSANWMSLMVKIVFAQLRYAPNINVLSLSRAEIIEQNLPLCNIAASIKAGFLDSVRDKHNLCNPI